MFTADLLTATQMLPSQMDDVLGELVTRGWITADGFAGLRTLIAEKSPRGRMASHHRSERRRTIRTALGRWSLRVPFAHGESAAMSDPKHSDQSSVPGTQQLAPTTSSLPATPNKHTIAEDWAWQLLRRWGIVFKDLLAREDGAPPWFEVLQVLRRLEARGEIRGGRFIVGVAGEQFALPDTIQQLRRLRDEPSTNELLVISASDPLNLVGIVTRHDRIPRTASNRLACVDGQPVATFQGGEVIWLATVSPDLATIIVQRLKGHLALSDSEQEAQTTTA